MLNFIGTFSIISNAIVFSITLMGFEFEKLAEIQQKSMIFSYLLFIKFIFFFNIYYYKIILKKFMIQKFLIF